MTGIQPGLHQTTAGRNRGDRAALTQTVIERIRQMNQALGSYAPEHWMNLPITMAQLKSLLFIFSEGQTNFRKLAEALGVTPPSVTGIVDHLVEQGLVSRQESPEDRRIFVLQVTPKGQTLLAEMWQGPANHLSAILARMTAEEISKLVESLGALIRAGETYRNQRS